MPEGRKEQLSAGAKQRGMHLLFSRTALHCTALPVTSPSAPRRLPSGKQHRNRLRDTQLYLSSEMLEWTKHTLKRTIIAPDVFAAFANGEVRRERHRARARR